MADELLNELKALISKNSKELKAQFAIVERVANSNVLGNLLSHDNLFSPKMGHLKAFWSDFESLTNLFYCSYCKAGLSMKYFNNVNAKVRCKWGKLNYDWKK